MGTSGANASSWRKRWESGRFGLVAAMARQQLGLFFRTGQIRYLVSFAELAVPPLSMLLILFAAASLLALTLLHEAGRPVVAAWWMTLAFYVLSAQLQRRASLQTWRALLTAPFAIIREFLLLLTKTISQKSDAWVRTKRENESSELEE